MSVLRLLSGAPRSAAHEHSSVRLAIAVVTMVLNLTFSLIRTAAPAEVLDGEQRELEAIADVALFVDRRQHVLHGLLREAKFACNFPVLPAGDHASEHVPLARGQVVVDRHQGLRRVDAVAESNRRTASRRQRTSQKRRKQAVFARCLCAGGATTLRAVGSTLRSESQWPA